MKSLQPTYFCEILKQNRTWQKVDMIKKDDYTD